MDPDRGGGVRGVQKSFISNIRWSVFAAAMQILAGAEIIRLAITTIVSHTVSTERNISFDLASRNGSLQARRTPQTGSTNSLWPSKRLSQANDKIRWTWGKSLT